MAEQGRTTRGSTKKVTEPVVTDTTSVAATGQTVAPSPSSRQTVNDDPPRPTLPAPSPRTGVLVNVDTVRTAFATGDASQSVGYVQHVLTARGFEPGNHAGIADHDTRVAFARFQGSIGEAPTGLPTAFSVDYLGFDVLD